MGCPHAGVLLEKSLLFAVRPLQMETPCIHESLCVSTKTVKMEGNPHLLLGTTRFMFIPTGLLRKPDSWGSRSKRAITVLQARNNATSSFLPMPCVWGNDKSQLARDWSPTHLPTKFWGPSPCLMKKKMSTCGHGIYKFKVSSLARKSFGAVASLDPLAENIWTGLLATLWVLIFSELKAVTCRCGLTVWMVNLGQS